LGSTYRQDYTYTAQTDYVAGEFYWPLRSDYKTFNTDYSAGKTLLSREQAGQEITWSVGTRLDHQYVMQAFGIQADHAFEFKRDPGSIDFSLANIVKWGLISVLMLILIVGVPRCSSNNTRDCSQEYNPNSTLSVEQQREQCERSKRSSTRLGGSWGGYSSGGGGHK
jgi:uncharacterized membrane protein YgcG